MPDYTPCALTIEPAGEATTLAEAWKLLPQKGTGFVTLADAIRRFDPADSSGWLLNAEVVEGDTTTVLRLDNGRWRAWRWTEGLGEPHKVRDQCFLSTEPAAGGKAQDLVYRSYWRKQTDDGIEVWTLVGSRFVGFGD